MKNNDEKINEIDAFIRATNMKSEIDIIHLQSSHSKKQPKTRNCISFSITEPTLIFINRSISFNVALCRDRVE